MCYFWEIPDVKETAPNGLSLWRAAGDEVILFNNQLVAKRAVEAFDAYVSENDPWWVELPPGLKLTNTTEDAAKMLARCNDNELTTEERAFLVGLIDANKKIEPQTYGAPIPPREELCKPSQFKPIFDACEKVLAEREAEFKGSADGMFDGIAELTKAMGSNACEGSDVAAVLLALKIQRMRANPQHTDSLVDCINYLCFYHKAILEKAE